MPARLTPHVRGDDERHPKPEAPPEEPGAARFLDELRCALSDMEGEQEPKDREAHLPRLGRDHVLGLLGDSADDAVGFGRRASMVLLSSFSNPNERHRSLRVEPPPRK